MGTRSGISWLSALVTRSREVMVSFFGIGRYLVWGSGLHNGIASLQLAGDSPLEPLGPGIGKNRCGSMGDCPCLAVMTISVESRRPCFVSSVTIWPMLASTN